MEPIKFKDIRVRHFHGYNIDNVVNGIREFILDPSHVYYELYDMNITYIPRQDPTHSFTTPNKDIWVEVTLFYKESKKGK